MKHKLIKYFLLSLFMAIFITSCRDKKTSPEYISPYYRISAKDSARAVFYEKMHRQRQNAINWRIIDEKNKKYLPKSAQNLGTWYEIGSTNQAGRVHTMDFDTLKNDLYVASAGGHIWKKNLSENENWSCLNNHFRIPDIVFLDHLYTTQGEKLLVATGAKAYDGFFSSADSGASWTKAKGLENIQNNGYIKRVLISQSPSPFILLLGEYQQDNLAQIAVFLSTDLGFNFREISANPGNVLFADIFMNKQNDIFAAIESSVYELDTLGNQSLRGIIRPQRIGSLMLTGTAGASANQLRIAIYADNQTDFYALGGNGFYEFISYIPENPFMINSLCHSSTNDNYMYFGGVNFYFSDNNGYNWRKVSDWTEYYLDINQKFHADIPGIKCFVKDDQEIIFTATDGGIYVSDIELSNVENLSLSGLNINQYYASLSSNLHVSRAVFGSQDQGLQQTDSLKPLSLNTIKQILSGDFGHLVSNNDAKDFWAVYPGFVVFSQNPDIRYYYNKSTALWLPPIVQYPGRNFSVWMAGGAKTDNNGQYLSELTYITADITARPLDFNFASVGSEMISAIEVSPFNDKVIFVSTNFGRFFRTIDGGISWKLTYLPVGPSEHYFYGAKILCSSQTDSLIFWAGSAYESNLYPVYVSTNLGNDFKPLGTNLPKTLVTGLALSNNDSLLFAASEIGPFAYEFSRNQWINLKDSMVPDAIFWNVEYIEQQNMARFSTFGRGIWDFKLQDGLQIYKPLVFKHLSDILINTTDTFISLALDSFFYHTAGLTLSYELTNEHPALCEAEIAQNVLLIKPLLKGETSISIKASDANLYFATDNFLVKTNYTPPAPPEKLFSIKHFPNPAGNELNLVGFNSFKSYDIRIYNINGVLVKSQSIYNTPFTLVVLSALNPGNYFLTIQSHDYTDFTRVQFVKVK